MRIFEKFSGENETRYWIGKWIFEHSKNTKELSFEIHFNANEWEITFKLGYIIGAVWLSIPHSLVFRVFQKHFWGKRFGEVGRSLGFAIGKCCSYSLWWWSDPNHPCDSWRYKFYILD